jgi:hypothetical protein
MHTSRRKTCIDLGVKPCRGAHTIKIYYKMYKWLICYANLQHNGPPSKIMSSTQQAAKSPLPRLVCLPVCLSVCLAACCLPARLFSTRLFGNHPTCIQSTKTVRKIALMIMKVLRDIKTPEGPTCCERSYENKPRKYSHVVRHMYNHATCDIYIYIYIYIYTDHNDILNAFGNLLVVLQQIASVHYRHTKTKHKDTLHFKKTLMIMTYPMHLVICSSRCSNFNSSSDFAEGSFKPTIDAAENQKRLRSNKYC